MQTALQLIGSCLTCLVPPPLLTVSQWADEFRYVSRRVSPEPGRWRTDRTPYLQEIMDCFNSPQVETIVFRKPARIGGTEAILNAIGFYIDYDPSPILYVQQTDGLAERFSKKILQPTIEETPALAVKVDEARAGKSGSTILEKAFPGGDLIISGAKSHTNFRMVHRRIIICDDIDGYDADVGGEGDPVYLAIERAANAPDKKIFLTSSPSISGSSRIDLAMIDTDQRFFKIPCLRCGAMQVLDWEDPKKLPSRLRWPAGKFHQAWFECESCNGEMKHHEKMEMLRNGSWEATRPFTNSAGFDGLSQLYSPFVHWSAIIDKWFKASKDSATLKVFCNTVAGQSWEEDAVENVPEQQLHARREKYPAAAPLGVTIITAGVDVQGDRLEVELVGWGRGEESWSLAYIILWGDTFKPSVWMDLDTILQEQIEHESGLMLRVSCVAIDSGYATDHVHNYVKPRQTRNIYAVKGDKGTMGHPLVNNPSTKNKKKIVPFIVGTYTAKSSIAARLAIVGSGPGSCHWPLLEAQGDHDPGVAQYGMEYFSQLTAEKKYKTMYRGMASYHWKKTRPRNEALDCRVYAYAALGILYNRNFKLEKHSKEMENRFEESLATRRPDLKQPEKPAEKQKKTRRQHSNGWF
jgi:phage terminase large subunit GpA-like protein